MDRHHPHRWVNFRSAPTTENPQVVGASRVGRPVARFTSRHQPRHSADMLHVGGGCVGTEVAHRVDMRRPKAAAEIQRSPAAQRPFVSDRSTPKLRSFTLVTPKLGERKCRFPTRRRVELARMSLLARFFDRAVVSGLDASNPMPRGLSLPGQGQSSACRFAGMVDRRQTRMGVGGP